jgi:hypothetical protein
MNAAAFVLEKGTGQTEAKILESEAMPLLSIRSRRNAQPIQKTARCEQLNRLRKTRRHPLSLLFGHRRDQI